MTDPSRFKINFSGTFRESQFNVGDHAVLTMHAGRAADERLTDDQLASLREQIARLEEEAATVVPEERSEAASEQLRDLAAATVGADEPDPSRLKRIGRWFVRNAPELAGSVTTLLLGPLVGTLVGAAGGLTAAMFEADDDAP